MGAGSSSGGWKKGVEGDLTLAVSLVVIYLFTMNYSRNSLGPGSDVTARVDGVRGARGKVSLSSCTSD